MLLSFTARQHARAVDPGKEGHPMRDWYKFETGNEQQRDTLLRYLKRTKVTHELEDRSQQMRCDWWRIKILITSPEKLNTINHYIRMH